MPQTITSGTQSTTYSITTPDEYVLSADRTQTAGTAIQATVTSGVTNITINAQLINTVSGQRAIRAGLVRGLVTVGADGLVQAQDGDAFQAQTATGQVDLTNLGQIVSATSITTITSTGANPPGAAYALNFNAATGATGAPSTDFTSGGTITNGAVGNTTALIRSDSGDAIRMGGHQTLVNYGTIIGNGPVSDSSTNNVYSGTSTATRYDISRGVRINAATATNSRIDNFGVITGAQHAVDVGNTAATNILVNNDAAGQIIGRNGSGVGADTVGTGAGTVVVTNSGLIRGAYAPAYDRAGLATADGDGDGVDIDGGATITNNAGATIEGTGAGGFDSNGRANNSEGISIGGGIIANAGTIRGATYGIVVNNDSNADGSRSGVIATQITNGATGTITGQNGYAIRFENKTGTAPDDDTIINYGAITGAGAVPDTAGTVLRQDGNPDAGTVGTLDGVTYTAADAGSVRFIRGDGSAVQTGEGADSVTNYGTLTATASGRALNLEGGADTLTLYTGSTVGGRLDGGAGSDTLNLRLDDRTGATGTGPNSGITAGTLGNAINFEVLNVQGGAWTIADAQGYAGGASVSAGATLSVAAGGALTAAVGVSGDLGGAGSVGAVTVQDGGSLSPGDGAGGTGRLSTGDLALASGAALNVQIGGTAAGAYDQVGVAGTVALGGAALNLAFVNGFATSAGQRFVLIDNDGADAVTGQLSVGGATLAEGGTFQASGRSFQITYQGDAAGAASGNDVVLTDVTPAPVYTIALDRASGPEGTGGAGTVFTYTVTRTGDTSAAGTVAVSLSGTATAPGLSGADYATSLVNGLVSFAAGAATATFTVTSAPDSRAEPDETVVATLGAITGGGSLGAQASATATILNDDVGLRPGARSDFNGDLTSDLVLQAGGSVVDWILGNGAYQSGNVLTNGTAGYTVVGTGDVSGDGTADLVLQSGNTVVDWIMRDGRYQGGNVLANAAGYTVRAVADLTGDGTADVVLQNGGSVVEWTLVNGAYQSGRVLATGVDGFTVVGAGDFDGDGDADLVLQNGGTVVAWTIQNGAYQGGRVLANAAGYTVVGTGDFNGNGTDDIVLQNGSTVVDWILANGQYQSGNVLTTGAAGFSVRATGDYNGDGTTDIALQAGTGSVVQWTIRNGLYAGGTALGNAGGYTVA